MIKLHHAYTNNFKGACNITPAVERIRQGRTYFELVTDDKGKDAVEDLVHGRNAYYLTYQTEHDVELRDRKFGSWKEMCESNEYAELADKNSFDVLRGFGYLIIRPGKLPMVGGFIGENMKDPSQ